MARGKESDRQALIRLNIYFFLPLQLARDNLANNGAKYFMIYLVLYHKLTLKKKNFLNRYICSQK